MFNNKNSQRGISLFLALIIMSIFLAIGLALNAILIGQIKTLSGMEESAVALYAADTGIERILYMDTLCRCYDPDDCCVGLAWTCLNAPACDEGIAGSDSPLTNNPFLAPLDPASYIVEFDDGARDVTSTGIYGGAKRSLHIAR